MHLFNYFIISNFLLVSVSPQSILSIAMFLLFSSSVLIQFYLMPAWFIQTSTSLGFFTSKAKTNTSLFSFTYFFLSAFCVEFSTTRKENA